MVAEDRPSSGGFAKCKPLAFSKASVARHFGRTSRDSGGGRRRGGGRLELFKRAHRNDTGENKGRRGSCGVGTAAAPRRPHCKIWLLNLKCDKMLRQPLRSGVWLNRLWAVLVINPSSLCLCVSVCLQAVETNLASKDSHWVFVNEVSHTRHSEHVTQTFSISELLIAGSPSFPTSCAVKQGRTNETEAGNHAKLL